MSFPYRPGLAEVEVTIRLKYACDQGEATRQVTISESAHGWAIAQHFAAVLLSTIELADQGKKP